MAKIKILHIEDEEMYQKLVCDMLGEEGYDVFSAGTGEEGLRMLEEIKPDLLILDINLPDADGYEICRSLRQEERWAKLPILMATVRRHPEEWRKGFSVGASDYVSKPLYGPELAERVKSCLAGKTAQGDGATNPEVLMIRATLIGNRGAFDVFVRQYKDDLFKTMQSEAGWNADEADDLVAMAFTRAYEHLDQFRGDSPFYTWIYCIAKNELKRKSRQIRTTPLEDMSQDDGEASASSPGLVGDRPAQSDANEQFRLELQSAIAEIPRRYRKPLELHLMHGLPYEMIARELEIPIGTIMSRLCRGKDHLRKVWQAIVHTETSR
jgi:RNA polymerase sigma factor (sigma-70 family)